MRMLSWNEYLQNFESWAESTRENYVNRIDDFSGAQHEDVAEIISCIYTESVASKLANKAMDAGIQFDSDDIFLVEFAINEATLQRMKSAKDDWALRRKQKKEKSEAFWTGVGGVMIVDLAIKSIFGKKKK